MSTANLEFDVVIAGGGFAGVYCAQSLAKELGPKALSRVAIISDHNFMVFQPMLPEVCGSSLAPRHIVNAVRVLCRGVSVLRGNITKIDLNEGRLKLNAGPFTKEVTVKFKHLALAMGGVVDLSRVPGMPEHAFLMKSIGDALQLRGALIDRFEEALLQPDPEIKKRLLTFVIVGGGFSGVETTGQVVDLLKGINRFYPGIAQPDFRVILIHSCPHVLPEISESLGIYAEQALRERGVEVILNARVAAMTSSKVHLLDGRIIESHTVVSTVGNAPHPVMVNLCELNGLESVKGRVVTESSLRVKGKERLWAAGDCAVVPKEGGGTCPPTAQFAFRQGVLLGKNIARALKNEPLKPFTFQGVGELASIGHRKAVAEIFGLKFSGFIAWFMWRTIYLMKLPGLERKLRVMIDWTLDLFFPRDMILMRSEPTRVLQEVHLEKGDQLFHSGEPAFSFYIVKSGRIDLLDENGFVKSLSAGEHFGERALLQDNIWRFSAVATEPTTLVALDAATFKAIDGASISMHKLFAKSASQYATRKQLETLVTELPAELKEERVENAMTRSVTKLSTTMTVAQALQIICKEPYNSFPVVDAEGKALGMIHQDDIYDALQCGALNLTSTLGEIAPTKFSTLLPSDTVQEAVERFCRTGSRKLLVVDEAGCLKGILTPIDLLGRNLSAEISQSIDQGQ